MNETMIEFKQISHQYGHVPSVQNIDFTVNSHEVVGLLGPSGCGKSTLLRLAAGLETPSAGEIWLKGAKIADARSTMRPEDRGIGMVFQDYALFPHMNIMDNILFALNSHNNANLNSVKRHQMAIDALEQTHLTDYRDALPHQLSGGQQQRVALARALAPNPGLILLDEPFSGLDNRLKEQIRDDMLHVLREIGTAVLIVTHDSEEAMFMADRLMVMEKGSIIQTGAPVDVFCRPDNAFVAEFFGEVNRFETSVTSGMADTPFGLFPVDNIDDTDNAIMIIRNDGLIIDPRGETADAVVVETIMLGRYSIVHLELYWERIGAMHIHARVPGITWYDEGTEVSIKLDSSQVFVFSQQD
jgi:iron(III) transport system ATP-binding protein